MHGWLSPSTAGRAAAAPHSPSTAFITVIMVCISAQALVLDGGILAAGTGFLCAGRDMTDDSGKAKTLLETPGKPKARVTTTALCSAFCFAVISVRLHLASNFCLQEWFVLPGH